MPHLTNFTVEAYYEDGSVQARADFQAPDLITALNRATSCTAFLAGDVRSNTLRNDLMVACDGGALVSVLEALAADQMQVAA